MIAPNRRRLNLEGAVEGLLTYIGEAGFNQRNKDSKTRERLIKVRCGCGTEKTIAAASFISGNTQSCGCLRANVASNFLRNLNQRKGFQREDLTGQRFGRLIALSYNPNNKNRTMWNCECDCGGKSVVEATKLKKARTRSCGCYQRELMKGNSLSANAIVGQRFGTLVVISRGVDNAYCQARWNCQCVCGQMRLVLGQYLRNGRVKNCGINCTAKESS